MPVYQSFNKRIKAWVKYELIKGKGIKILDVKQQMPNKPFKGVPKRSKK